MSEEIRKSEELSDDELENVAGGFGIGTGIMGSARTGLRTGMGTGIGSGVRTADGRSATIGGMASHDTGDSHGPDSGIVNV